MNWKKWTCCKLFMCSLRDILRVHLTFPPELQKTVPNGAVGNIFGYSKGLIQKGHHLTELTSKKAGWRGHTVHQPRGRWVRSCWFGSRPGSRFETPRNVVPKRDTELLQTDNCLLRDTESMFFRLSREMTGRAGRRNQSITKMSSLPRKPSRYSLEPTTRQLNSIVLELQIRKILLAKPYLALGECNPLKGQCHEIFCFCFFHESGSPKPLIIT